MNIDYKQEFTNAVNSKIIELQKKFNCMNTKDGVFTMTKYQINNCILIHVEELLRNIPMYKGEINAEYLFYKEIKEKIEKEINNLNDKFMSNKYIVPYDLFGGEIQKGTIYSKMQGFSNKIYCPLENNLYIDKFGLPAEIVEKWDEFKEQKSDYDFNFDEIIVGKTVLFDHDGFELLVIGKNPNNNNILIGNEWHDVNKINAYKTK